MEPSVAMSSESTELRQRYLTHLNQVNLLLVKEHDLRKDEELYTEQLATVERLIATVQKRSCYRCSLLSAEAEYSYMSAIIQSNHRQIVAMQNQVQSEEAQTNEIQSLQFQTETYKKISQDFHTSTQQRLSTMRGKVDELKKKIKEANKDIINLEQEHFEEIDQHSFNLSMLHDYRRRNGDLRTSIQQLLARQRNPSK